MTGNIVTHQLGAAKFDYEFMGKSVDQLSSDYGFPTFTLEAAISEGEWQRRLEPTELPKTADLAKFAEELESLTRSKLTIISLFRQIENQPLYAQIEKAILEKMLVLVAELQSMDDKAANKLMNITKALAAIQERNPVDLAGQLKEELGKGGGGVTVQIMNHIN